MTNREIEAAELDLAYGSCSSCWKSWSVTTNGFRSPISRELTWYVPGALRASRWWRQPDPEGRPYDKQGAEMNRAVQEYAVAMSRFERATQVELLLERLSSPNLEANKALRRARVSVKAAVTALSNDLAFSRRNLKPERECNHGPDEFVCGLCNS